MCETMEKGSTVTQILLTQRIAKAIRRRVAKKTNPEQGSQESKKKEIYNLLRSKENLEVAKNDYRGRGVIRGGESESITKIGLMEGTMF